MTAARPNRGALIALEGIDGAGKSSVARRLATRWRAEGRSVTLRREPSDPDLGRAALRLAPTDAWGSAMVFSLDRLVARPGVEAELANNRIILQDRSYFSTLAYQADRLGPEEARRILHLQHRVARRPDRILWLDLPPEEAVRRVRARGGPRSLVERRAFLTRVRTAYEGLSTPPRWIRLNAHRPLEDVVDEADRRLRRFLTSRVGPDPRRR